MREQSLKVLAWPLHSRGIYGHLTLEADGSYSYVADQGAANALGAGLL
ncbi:MAG: hypothetical protein IPJ25_08605 [Rhodocyclaceae bacterium]|nr:hypothetical protein [Rhodocyclaceae bacterium]